MQSFSKLYAKLHGIPFDADKFSKRLWGDFYYDSSDRTFKKKQPASGGERSFVHFLLEPLYKIYSQVIGEHKKSVEATLSELGVTLPNAAYKLNVRPLLAVQFLALQLALLICWFTIYHLPKIQHPRRLSISILDPRILIFMRPLQVVMLLVLLWLM